MLSKGISYLGKERKRKVGRQFGTVLGGGEDLKVLWVSHTWPHMD